MSRKIKVCHFTSIHPAGDTRIFVKECSTLAAAGYDVFLVAVNVTESVKNGVHIINVASHGGGRIKRMTSTASKVYQKAAELNADIYHFHDPELIPYALRLIKKGKKVVYDVHEDIPRQILAKYYIPKLFRLAVSAITERIENYAASKFSWIITATPFIQSRFLKFNEKVTAVCNFPIVEELSVEMEYASKPHKLCYVGSITRERGVIQMVTAMDTLPYQLHLCGSFSPESLRDEVMQLKGWEKVIEHGYSSRETIKSVLADSRIGLVTLHPIINYVDAYPVKMFEYMLSGIPVVASNIPLWENIVKSAHCGICVDPYNIEEIRKAIVQIMEDTSTASTMGENGKKAVVENYNWKKEGQKLIEIYQQLMPV